MHYLFVSGSRYLTVSPRYIRVVLLKVVVSAICEENCTPSADDLVSLLETEVDSYDQFIYGRYLTANQNTCRRVVTGMLRLRRAFKEEMSVILGATVRQLKTVQDTAKGTDAGPCVDQMVRTLERDTNEGELKVLLLSLPQPPPHKGLDWITPIQLRSYYRHRNSLCQWYMTKVR